MTESKTDSGILDRSEFEHLTSEQQRCYYNDHGFVLLPEVVSIEQMARIDAELEGEDIPLRWDYRDRWPGPELEKLITNPRLLGPLQRCYGEDIRFFKSVYTDWRDRKVNELSRQPLHRDYTPDPGDKDYRNSCAAWVNVGHYFIDLEVDEGPLWVVPGSHKFAWTGARGSFEDHVPQMVLARAGDAVMFHNLTMHAGGAMKSGRLRPSVFQSYRSGWAAPLGEVAEWANEVMQRSPPELRRLLEGQNDGLRVDLHGIIQS